MLGPGSAVLGLCWACVGPSEVFVGAMFAHRGAILVASLRNPFFFIVAVVAESYVFALLLPLSSWLQYHLSFFRCQNGWLVPLWI